MLTDLVQKLQDQFTEREVVGGVLLYSDSIPNVFDILFPEHIYNEELKAIYRVAVENYNHAQPADLQTLANAAGVHVSKLVGLMASVVLGAQRSAAGRLVELAKKREVAKKLARLTVSIETSSIEELTGQLTEIAITGSSSASSKQILGSDQLIDRAQQLQESRAKEPDIIRGIRTGYPALDSILRGLRSRRMTVLAAATGFGKSTLTANIWVNTLLANIKILLISCENDINDTLDRIAGIITGLDLKDVESGAKAYRITERFNQTFAGKTAFISDNSPRNMHKAWLRLHVPSTVISYAWHSSTVPATAKEGPVRLSCKAVSK